MGCTSLLHVMVSFVLAWERCRISPSHFLAACRKRRQNESSFVLLCFVLFAFLGCINLCIVCIFQLVICPIFSYVNGTVQPTCAVKTLLTHSPVVM